MFSSKLRIGNYWILGKMTNFNLKNLVSYKYTPFVCSKVQANHVKDQISSELINKNLLISFNFSQHFIFFSLIPDKVNKFWHKQLDSIKMGNFLKH